MLIEFKVGNFRSIWDPQVLTMVAGPGSELPQNICPADFDPDMHLVRAAVIYGPNAGGKSNFIRALSFMRWLILSSAKESQHGEKIPVKGFLFDKTNQQQSTEFEIIFSRESVRYQYGFVVSESRIIEEWLFAYPHGRPQQWFARKYDKQNDKYDWEFSKLFKGNKQAWAASTRSNALFFSTAVQLNNEQLIPLFSWFQNDLIVIPAVRDSRELNYFNSIEQIKTLEGKQRIMKYMKIVDPSITDILYEIDKFSEDKLPKSLRQEIKDILKKDMAGKELAKIDFVHENNVSLNETDESDGTRKFFAYAGRWDNAIVQGQVIVIDELDSSLHPLVAKFLVDLICSNVNKKNAQLIFTTHNTALLDNEIFRRDQVWFVEKDKKNSTQLYPLLDFSPRKNESIGKGYLQGRYGALPYIGEWKFNE